MIPGYTEKLTSLDTGRTIKVRYGDSIDIPEYECPPYERIPELTTEMKFEGKWINTCHHLLTKNKGWVRDLALRQRPDLTVNDLYEVYGIDVRNVKERKKRDSMDIESFFAEMRETKREGTPSWYDPVGKITPVHLEDRIIFHGTATLPKEMNPQHPTYISQEREVAVTEGLRDAKKGYLFILSYPRLAAQRDIFIDMEWLSAPNEFTKAFLFFGGIPRDAITDIIEVKVRY